MQLPRVRDAAARPDGGGANDRPRPPRAVHRAFRPELQGLRAIAVLLVAVYHIWFGRVSGGVDVFLLFTGFLITGSLLRSIERKGRIEPIRFLARLAQRLLPTIAVVLVGVLIATYLWMPPSRWAEILRETLASALYYENWLLAEKSVDYLTRDQGTSPLQHFWSLAIQGQFYLVWLALMALVLLVVRRFGADPKWLVFTACSMVFAASLTYSVLQTGINQPWAYFDTGARLWEFGFGGMLAVALPYLNPPRAARIALGWIGLVALFACGALFDVSAMFPGYIAFWPLLAATCIMIAGETGSPVAADRLLTSKPLVRVGDWSYALYLWHWPVLLMYLQVAGRDHASWRGGAYVLIASLALAAATTWIVQQRIANLPRFRSSPGWSFGIAVLFIAPVVMGASFAQNRVLERDAELAEAAEAAAQDTEVYPGAAVLADEELAAALPEAEFIPPLTDELDLPELYDQGCDAEMDGPDAIVCEFGDPEGEHTVLLVGASRIGHWVPAFEAAAQEQGWRLVSITKDGCQFTTETPYDDDGNVNESCISWNEDVAAEIEEIAPDLVVTLSSRAFAESESVYDGFAERWEQLDEQGIQVLALRDIPRLEENLPECMELHGEKGCVTAVDFSQDETPPEERYEDAPANVTFDDLTAYVCPDGECPAVIGNVRTYRDHSHLTATYSATLGPFAAAAVLDATGW
ncbi:acyltransferase family protein [Glycomyces harbinensis]|uniref:Peptidoglycan/LPS O-acetylase OafA/YrhL, contains acyltransferase and SGNH-hydrolase domains n=1 Tax=Glycomyces harbinensis TaxID=58114 RepID=A0A1G7CNQ2_9ACTN|nr:acyltransferase family protein [Glycomyces harbinensis]SDE40962.1 Peptidoglycan/LPS O-acetylase OafA/YrhL, contains acyltransferase and SGNH-hydrolase domains [Glycomyces harbinensis]